MPAATQTLVSLECSRFLVGITPACRTGTSGHSVPLIAECQESNIAIKFQLLADLNPTLVISTEPLPGDCLPDSADVFLWSPHSVEGMFDLILSLAERLSIEELASDLVVQLRERFFEAADFVNPYISGPPVCVLESLEPLVVSGRWTSQLLERAGAQVPLNPTVPIPDAGAGAGAQQAHREAGPSRPTTQEEIIGTSPTSLIVCLPGISLKQSVVQTTEWIAMNPWVSSLPFMRVNSLVVLDGRETLSEPGPCLIDTYRWLVGWINDRPSLMESDFPCWHLGSDR